MLIKVPENENCQVFEILENFTVVDYSIYKEKASKKKIE